MFSVQAIKGHLADRNGVQCHSKRTESQGKGDVLIRNRTWDRCFAFINISAALADETQDFLCNRSSRSTCIQDLMEEKGKCSDVGQQMFHKNFEKYGLFLFLA